MARCHTNARGMSLSVGAASSILAYKVQRTTYNVMLNRPTTRFQCHYFTVRTFGRRTADECIHRAYKVARPVDLNTTRLANLLGKPTPSVQRNLTRLLHEIMHPAVVAQTPLARVKRLTCSDFSFQSLNWCAISYETEHFRCSAHFLA